MARKNRTPEENAHRDKIRELLHIPSRYISTHIRLYS